MNAQEYVAATRIVGVANRYVRTYPVSLVEHHLDALGQLMTSQSLLANTALEDQARQPSTEENAFEKWIRLHAALLQSSLKPQRKTRFFQAAFVNETFLQEIQEALHSKLVFEYESLGRIAKGIEITRLINEAYPNSPIAKTAQMWATIYDGNTDTAVNFRKKLKLSGADMRLLGLFIDRSVWSNKAAGYPKILDALEAIHKKSNPSRRDMINLTEHLKAAYLIPFATSNLTQAMDIAPNEFQLANLANKLEIPPSDFEDYAQRLSHLSSIAFLRGKHYQQSDRKDLAKEQFRLAIEANPLGASAYRYLSDLLAEEDDVSGAISVLQEFLQQDVRSLASTRARIRAAKLIMEEGDIETAYAELEEASSMGSGDALFEFASISEKTDRIIQAERYFEKAAERYSNGASPAELALFYYRQGNRQIAIKTLSDYLRYNRPHYFVEPLAKYFHEQGNPQEAIAIAKEVSPENWKGVKVKFFLAQEFEKLGDFETAAELYGELALNLENPRQRGPYIYAPFYLESSEAAKSGSSSALLNKVLDAYAPLPPVVTEYFAVHLLMNDMPKEAIPVFLRRYGMPEERRRSISLLMAAVAWRQAGDDNLAYKQTILDHLDDSNDEWLNTRARFLLKEIDKDQLMAEARGRARLCEAHYFLGMIAESQNDIPLAQEELIKSLRTRASNHMEYQYAYLLLQEISS